MQRIIAGLAFAVATVGAGAVGAEDCCDAPASFYFQRDQLPHGGPDLSWQVPGETFASAYLPCDEVPGEGLLETRDRSARVWVGLSSNLRAEDGGTPEGISGWYVSLEIDGDIALVEDQLEDPLNGDFVNEARDNTVAARAGGLRLAPSAFYASAFARPEKNGGRRGIVQAVAFLSPETSTLEPTGSATVLNLEVVPAGEPSLGGAEGRVFVSDRLIGIGEEVPTTATVDAVSFFSVCPGQPLRVRFLGGGGDFIRCDPNGDGRSDIGDVAWILNALFKDGRATSCPESGDCNADRRTDISDVIYALGHQFLGSAAPPAPFPDCGQPDGGPVGEERCPAGSTICP